MNLLAALARTSSLTMLSRVLGLVRENMNARQFGAGVAMDAFTVAFMLPNLFRRIFAEGAFSQAFVPILSEYKVQRGEAATHDFIAQVSGWLALALVAFTVLGVLAAPVLVWAAASGFARNADKLELTLQLTRLMFPYILLISLSSLAGSLLNAWQRFAIPAFTPALLNLAMIAAAWWLAPHLAQPILALALGVLLGGVLQLAFQLPWLWRMGLLRCPRLRGNDTTGVMRVVRQMGPALFGVSVAQVSLLLNRAFASWLPDGSVSWLQYADRLMELPTGVLAVALGTVLLPTLSQLRAAHQPAAYAAMLDWGLRLCCLLAIPAALAFALIADPIVATLFYTGKFSPHDVQMTTHALIAYAVGLGSLMAIKVLAPAYYARQDVRTPVKVGILTLVLTQLLNLLLIAPLQHAGLALAISLGACFNAGVLFWGLHRRGDFQAQPGWGIFWLRLAVALGVMSIALLLSQQALSTWGANSWLAGSALWRVVRLTLLVSAGGGIYFATLFLLGMRPRDFRPQSSASVPSS